MTVHAETLKDLDQQIERAQRRTWIRTLILCAITVAVAALLLLGIWQQVNSANYRLDALHQQTMAAEEARKAAESARTTAEKELQKASTELASAQSQTEQLNRQLGELKTRLETSQKLLAEALNLEKYAFPLNWADLKLLAMQNGGAARLLEVIGQLKNEVHWSTTNSVEGGFNSPGFATYVLRRAGRLAANAELGSLPRDTGAPHPGDVVLYETGYSMFYFLDAQRREFVIGMTPFGVTSLRYDFGAKRVAVLRTGFER